ncbi:MAG: hypothetical protein ACI8RD_006376, partial [Bacillariaceae sp.]
PRSKKTITLGDPQNPSLAALLCTCQPASIKPETFHFSFVIRRWYYY